MKETWWDSTHDWHIELEDYNLLKRNCDGPIGKLVWKRKMSCNQSHQMGG